MIGRTSDGGRRCSCGGERLERSDRRPSAHPPHPGPGQSAGHRQHRQRGADREELRDRAHAAGEAGDLRSLADRRHRPQHAPTSWPGIEILDSLEAALADCVSRRGAHRRGSARPSGGPLRPREAAAELVQRGGDRAGRDRRGPGGQRAHQRRARPVPRAGDDPDRSGALLAQPGAGGRDHGLRDLDRPRRRGRAAQAAAQGAAPATSAQLEELFGDWRRALWAIDFFKTRRSESVMRSFREIVFRAELDGREASLVRAMGIEVVRYLARAGLAVSEPPWRIPRDHGYAPAPTGRRTGIPTRRYEPAADRAARRTCRRPRPRGSRRCATGC